MKMMSYTISNHSPNITYLALMQVLGYPTQVYRLSIKSATSRYLIIPITI